MQYELLTETRSTRTHLTAAAHSSSYAISQSCNSSILHKKLPEKQFSYQTEQRRMDRLVWMDRKSWVIQITTLCNRVEQKSITECITGQSLRGIICRRFQSCQNSEALPKLDRWRLEKQSLAHEFILILPYKHLTLQKKKTF